MPSIFVSGSLPTLSSTTDMAASILTQIISFWSESGNSILQSLSNDTITTPALPSNTSESVCVAWNMTTTMPPTTAPTSETNYTNISSNYTQLSTPPVTPPPNSTESSMSEWYSNYTSVYPNDTSEWYTSVSPNSTSSDTSELYSSLTSAAPNSTISTISNLTTVSPNATSSWYSNLTSVFNISNSTSPSSTTTIYPHSTSFSYNSSNTELVWDPDKNCFILVAVTLPPLDNGNNALAVSVSVASGVAALVCLVAVLVMVFTIIRCRQKRRQKAEFVKDYLNPRRPSDNRPATVVITAINPLDKEEELSSSQPDDFLSTLEKCTISLSSPQSDSGLQFHDSTLPCSTSSLVGSLSSGRSSTAPLTLSVSNQRFQRNSVPSGVQGSSAFRGSARNALLQHNPRRFFSPPGSTLSLSPQGTLSTSISTVSSLVDGHYSPHYRDLRRRGHPRHTFGSSAYPTLSTSSLVSSPQSFAGSWVNPAAHSRMSFSPSATSSKGITHEMDAAELDTHRVVIQLRESDEENDL